MRKWESVLSTKNRKNGIKIEKIENLEYWIKIEKYRIKIEKNENPEDWRPRKLVLTHNSNNAQEKCKMRKTMKWCSQHRK